MLPIQMVNLHSQYQDIKPQIDEAMQNVIADSAFIGGKYVAEFSNSLKSYLNGAEVVPCGNGTDALQLALMALNLLPNDEVIVPAFSFVAPAEATALLGLKPVLADVDLDTFNLTAEAIAAQITPRTKAIIVVHLFGQPADMESIMQLSKQYNLKVIEDVAQAFGAKCMINGKEFFAGTVGDIGCTSFFPSKNLACFGDGGAVYTKNVEIADRVRKIANHGQQQKYIHELVGVNSRLDGLQAAILNVKLKYLDKYLLARQKAANFYHNHLNKLYWLTLPKNNGGHTYNQYTVKLAKEIDRNDFVEHLKANGIPSMIYYHQTLTEQLAYRKYSKTILPIADDLCLRVLSLPMHTELTEAHLTHICNTIKSFNG